MRIMKRYLIFNLFILTIAVFFGSLGYGQEEAQQSTTFYPVRTYKYKSRKECSDKFDINLALSDRAFPVGDNRGALGNYFNCIAVVQLDSGACNNLSSPQISQNCIERFKEISFYSNIFLQKAITPDVLRNCPTNKDIKFCKQFANALIKGDDSLCPGNDKSCKEIIKMDANLATSQQTKDYIYFLKAIRDGEINNCSKIKDGYMQTECKAYITKDSKICNEDKEFKRIRDIYCQHYSP